MSACKTIFALAFCLLLIGCKESTPKIAPRTLPRISAPTDLWKEFSGEKAFEHVRTQVALGARPSGSATIEKARTHIADTLKHVGWQVERQEFEETPVPGKGVLKFVNLIARFSATAVQPVPTNTQRVIVCSHYDTKRMSGINFVGANDSASSTGALLELARVLATAPQFAEHFELVFFDGEEAVEKFSEPLDGPDGLIGSRHYARTLRESGRAKQFQFAILWDMIGDKNLTITLPSDTPPQLASALFAAGEKLGTRKHLSTYSDPILDDHVPLQIIARIPSMDIIDFDYPPWHTSGDTLDKLSPDSLRIIGQLTLYMLIQEFGK